MDKNKNKFPTPHTQRETLALENSREEYDRAKNVKKIGASIALLASIELA